MLLLNGKVETSLSVYDRAIQYGDGCFTTLLVSKGFPVLLTEHLQRLSHHTQKLDIKYVSIPLIEKWIKSVAASVDKNKKMVIKVLISRGVGGRGYSPLGCQSPNILVSLHDYPVHYNDWKRDGITLSRSKQQICLSPLGGMKHLNRLEQVMLKAEVDASPFDDLLVCDLNHKVIETSVANVFWRKGKEIFTPRIELSGVAGIMRSRVMQIAAHEMKPIKEISVGFDHLHDINEMFITNSVMGLVPVNRIDNHVLSDFSYCSVLRKRLSA